MNRPNSVLFFTSPSTAEPTGVLLGEGLPRVLERLLQAQRDAALHLIDLEDHHLDLLGGGDDLARVDVLLGPGHLGHVDQAFDARLQLHERAVIGDVRDAAFKLGAHGVAGGDALPRIGKQLLDAQGDAVRLVVDLDDLHLDRLTDRYDLGRMVHAPPGHVGDVQQAVDAAEIHEGAVLGDVLDHAVDDLALFEVGHELGALLGAALFENRAAGHHDVAAAAVHLEDLERLRHAHERGDVAHGADVHLRAGQERHGAVEVDRVAALHLVEDHAVDALLGLEGLFELHPRLFAPGLVAGDDGLAQRILDALHVDLDLVADLDRLVAVGTGEFLEGDASLGLGADIDDRDVLFDRDHLALHDRAFADLVREEGFFEQGREIFTARLLQSCRHRFS
jgi:hypothetical protein